jgi:hypothetical protein
VAVVLIALLPFVVFAHALLPGRILAPVDLLMTGYPWRALASDVTPANPLLTDVTYLVHPLLLWGAREIKEGRLPLWNPQHFAGAPYLANPHTAVFFPLTWLMWLLPAAPALTLQAIGRIAFVGVATYWCCRRLHLGRGSAALGAVAFMLNGHVAAWLHWPYASTMAFLPLLVGLVEYLRARCDTRAIAALALAVALGVFAGYPQGALTSVLVATVWALATANTAVAGARGFLLRFAAGVALGGAVAAVQLLPFLEYARESAVVAYRAQWLPYLSLPTRAAVTWLVPFFFGGPDNFQGDWNFNVVSLGVGVVPLLGLPLALVLAWQKPAVRVMTGLAVVTAAIIYGLPWLGRALASLPLVGWGQTLRIAPVLPFAVAMLGAIGVDALSMSSPVRRRRAALVVAGTVAALATGLFVGVAFQSELLPRPTVALHVLGFLVTMSLAAFVVLRILRRPDDHGRAVIALVALELVTLAPVAIRINTVAHAAWLYPESPVLRALRDATATDHSRVLLGRHNMAMLYGIADPTGHDGMTPVHLEEIAGPLGTGATIGIIGSEPLGAGAVFSSGALDALGVRWFVVPPGAGPPRSDAVLRYDARDARVYENPRALPRVLLVPGARCVSGSDSRQLVRAGIDWRRELVLTGDCGSAPAGSTSHALGSASIRAYGPTRVEIDVDAPAPTYLVLFDEWFPGWRARVDGLDTRVFRADHAFRAVWIPGGRHVVDFDYRPVSLWLGALITVLALTVVGLLTITPRWRRLGMAVCALLVLGAAPRAQALEPTPLELTAPSRVDHLQTATIGIRRRATTSTEPVDLYLIWAFRPDARFLTADGTWTSEARAIARGVHLAELEPLTIHWRAEPATSISLALLAVRTGAHPLDRSAWLWSPELRWVTVRPGHLGAASASGMLVGLGAASLLSVLAVSTSALWLRRQIAE